LFYGTPGLGSTAHVSCELFKSMTGIEITHVPYKGSAPALTDLIAGRVFSVGLWATSQNARLGCGSHRQGNLSRIHLATNRS